jgi:predicted DNA-binding protein
MCVYIYIICVCIYIFIYIVCVCVCVCVYIYVARKEAAAFAAKATEAIKKGVKNMEEEDSSFVMPDDLQAKFDKVSDKLSRMRCVCLGCL